jgi:hypothetical protein
MPPTEASKAGRWLAGLGLAVCCLVSGLLALLPSMFLLLASMTIWRPIAVVDSFEDLPAWVFALWGALLLLVASTPVVIGTLTLRRKAGWHRAVAPIATALIVAAGLVIIYTTGAP